MASSIPSDIDNLSVALRLSSRTLRPPKFLIGFRYRCISCPSRKPHPGAVRPNLLVVLCRYLARPQPRRIDSTGPCHHARVFRPDRRQIGARGGAGPATCWRGPWQGAKDRIRRPAAGNDDAGRRPGERRRRSRRRSAQPAGGQDCPCSKPNACASRDNR